MSGLTTRSRWRQRSKSKNLDLATHVEPFATRLIDQLGGVPIYSSLDAWGPHGPDCVTNTTAKYLEAKPATIKKYLKALLRADAAIKADIPKAIDVLDAAKFYRVNKQVLTSALPRQMPQVDITKGGDKGMEIAVADMVQLGYLKSPPPIIDTKLLKEVLGLSDRTGALDSASVPVAEAPAQRMVPSWAWVLFKGLVPWAVVITIWELAAASGWSGSVLFPPPSAFLSYAIESDFRVGFGGDAMPIPIAILVSALRVLAGLAIGFAAALATGILISASGSFSDMILPLVRGLAPIAPIAWIPLGIVLFGIGNPTAVFVVFMGVYFILTISTVAAVKAVDQRLIKTARSFGASKAQVWTRVIFPAVLPQVFTMLRINFFAAWMAVLAAEMVGVKNGLGMMIILGREMFNTKLILLGMCIVGATGYAVDVLLVQIQRKILWWQQS